MVSLRRLLVVTLLLSALMVHPAQAATASKGPVPIVASFSILGDLVKEVGGEAVNVKTLVGPNGDAHTYQPTPDDVKAVAQAEIIAINGLKFEGWIGRVVAASGTKAKLLVASAGVRPHASADEDGNVTADPHAWQNLENGQLYVRNITAALKDARPELAEIFAARGKALEERLAKLDQETRARLAEIPVAKRKIITNHDAFAYFADAYSVKFLAPVGLSTEAEPSAADVAKLIALARKEGVKKIFMENMSDPRLMEQIAKDSGTLVGGTLYPDALSAPDGEAPTYEAMFRHNIDLIIGAMK